MPGLGNPDQGRRIAHSAAKRRQHAVLLVVPVMLATRDGQHTACCPRPIPRPWPRARLQIKEISERQQAAAVATMMDKYGVERPL